MKVVIFAILLFLFAIIICLSRNPDDYIYIIDPNRQATGTNTTLENMAPLSVFDNPHGYFYIAQTPRRNMSYDLRGDPFRIPKQTFIWNNSSIPEYEAVPVFYGDLLLN